MQDGQNLFNEATSFNGIEWKMDETAQRLIQSNAISPMIIVGIYNTEQRTPEFTPPNMGTGAKGELAKPRGDAFGKFIVEELKPFIDARYRTMPDRAHTAIGGSAMGGLASLYIAKAHGEVFGAVAVCSPWLRAPDGQAKLMPDFGNNTQWLKRTRFYIDMGTAGGGAGYPPNTDPKDVSKPQVAQDALNDARALVAAFDSAGLQRGKDYVYEEVPGEFNEPAWQTRVEPMLKALYPPGAPATQPSAG
jgi:enterochelin esterase-like enzyme